MFFSCHYAVARVFWLFYAVAMQLLRCLSVLGCFYCVADIFRELLWTFWDVAMQLLVCLKFFLAVAIELLGLSECVRQLLCVRFTWHKEGTGKAAARCFRWRVTRWVSVIIGSAGRRGVYLKHTHNTCWSGRPKTQHTLFNMHFILDFYAIKTMNVVIKVV